MQRQHLSVATDQDITLFRQQSLFDATPLLKKYRDKMQSWYKKAPIPDHKDEAWRFMPLPDLVWEQFTMADALVPTVLLPNELFFGDMRDFVMRYPGIARKYLAVNNRVPWKKCILSIFTESCWNKGVVLYVPRKTSVDEIIDLPNMLSYAQSLLVEKIIIILEEGASIQIGDIYRSSTKACPTIFRSIDCYLASHAQLTMVYDQDCNSNQSIFSRTSFYLDKESILNYAIITTGSRVNKSWLDIVLQGPGAEAHVRGLYLLSGSQYIDITSAQMHQKSHTTSDLILKGVVSGQAHSVYRGTIFIDKQAYRTNASQENKNILLSDAARAHSIPSLEVLNHDVQCSHGSAVGQFDKEQLFYVQARGLEEKMAKKLLLEGFLSDLFSCFDAKILKKIHTSLKTKSQNFYL